MKSIYLFSIIFFSWGTVIAQPVSGESAPSLSGSSRSDSVFHFAGYADATYIINEKGSDVFAAKLAPIVHYQFQDWFLFEAEGEFEFEREDSTEKSAALEYAMLNFIINDNLSVGVGRFLSPVGQFVQNLHPSWINKLPTMPIGFAGGHHGASAAPNTDFGVLARGGFKTG